MSTRTIKTTNVIEYLFTQAELAALGASEHGDDLTGATLAAVTGSVNATTGVATTEPWKAGHTHTGVKATTQS